MVLHEKVVTSACTRITDQPAVFFVSTSYFNCCKLAQCKERVVMPYNLVHAFDPQFTSPQQVFHAHS